MRARHLLAALPVIVWAAPVAAQSMDHSTMPMEATPGDTHPVAPAPAAAPACSAEHAAMGHCTLADVPPPIDPAPPIGQALPPEPVAADYADRIWGRAAMAPTRTALRRDHGGMTFAQVRVDLLEYGVRDGRDGYRWDGAGWFGGDVNRLVVKSEGDGNIGGGVEEAEVQALYSRAIGPYINLQAGIRHDIRPRSARSYAAIGVEGLAPYWFDVEGTLFLSDKGDISARIEGYYDQRITQRLILQPRAEIDLAAQDVPDRGVAAGVSEIELGLRLRYEIVREVAPYIGISWSRRVGETAGFARAAGEDAAALSGVIGLRGWF